MNGLKLDFQEAIIRLRAKGWSRRAIARELGVNRETVGRYLRLSAKPATELPAGSELDKRWEIRWSRVRLRIKTSQSAHRVSRGRRSLSARWEEKIVAKLDTGLSAQRIYQDLVAEDQFSASYDR